MYFISGFQCKAVNKTFRVNNNEYELTLGKFANVVLCTEDCGDVPEQTYVFVKIAEIEDSPTDQLVGEFSRAFNVPFVLFITAQNQL